MLEFLRPSLTLIAGFTLVLGVAFPLLFVGFGDIALPFEAHGSMIVVDGRTVGSALIGQDFSAPDYFHGRPSALTGTDPKDPSKTVPTPYDASESGASNLGPASAALVSRVRDAVVAVGGAHGGHGVPGDAVTSSGSGLDPDISPANARDQVARVAAARGVPAGRVEGLVDASVRHRSFGFLGEPRVNVLELNLALDRAFPAQAATPGAANPGAANPGAANTGTHTP